MGVMAYEAESTAIKLGCIGINSSRPVSTLIVKNQDIERYQLTCTEGLYSMWSGTLC